jgi:tetratricopeptide (TPR) repeat protein
MRKTLMAGMFVLAITSPVAGEPLSSPDAFGVTPSDTGETLRVRRCYNTHLEAIDRIAACQQLVRDKSILSGYAAMLSRIYPEQSDVASARILYEQMIAQDPSGSFGHALRGVILAAGGDYAAALNDANIVIEHTAYPQFGLESRCFIRAVAGQEMEPGLADCDAALARAPRDETARQTRGFALFRMGRMAEAVAACDAALALDRRDSAALYVRSLAERAQGNAAGADADLAVVRDIEPQIGALYALYGVK